jgi:casein kinase 1
LFDRNAKFSTKEEKIKYYEQQKLSIIPEVFCHDLPPEMGAYMTYIKAMQTNQMNEKVDYDYLKKLFRNLFNKHSTLENFQYDWVY